MSASHLIMGKNAVMEVARHRPEVIQKVFLAEGKSVKELERFPTKTLSKQALSDKLNSTSHQGVAALVKTTMQKDLKSYLGDLPDPCLLVMVDSINDPQNLGALIRASYCLGASGLIFSKNRGCGITPVVTKAANGATEFLPLFEVSNLANSLEMLHKEHFTSYLADKDQNSLPFTEVEAPERGLLLMGSEEKGVQPLLKKKISQTIHIPMQGVLDSLNVSQALSIILSRWAIS